MPHNREQQRAAGSIGGHASWANTVDRAARTRPGQAAFQKSFETKVDPEGILDPALRHKLAQNAMKAHFKQMAAKSAKVRKAKSEIRLAKKRAAKYGIENVPPRLRPVVECNCSTRT